MCKNYEGIEPICIQQCSVDGMDYYEAPTQDHQIGMICKCFIPQDKSDENKCDNQPDTYYLNGDCIPLQTMTVSKTNEDNTTETIEARCSQKFSMLEKKCYQTTVCVDPITGEEHDMGTRETSSSYCLASPNTKLDPKNPELLGTKAPPKPAGGSGGNSLSDDMKDLGSDLNKTGDSLNKNTKAIEKNTKAENNNTKALEENSKQIGDLNKYFKDFKNENNDSELIDAVKIFRGFSGNVTKSMKTVTNTFESITITIEKAKDILDDTEIPAENTALASLRIPEQTIILFKKPMKIKCFLLGDMEYLIDMRVFISLFLQLIFIGINIKILYNFIVNLKG